MSETRYLGEVKDQFSEEEKIIYQGLKEILGVRRLDHKMSWYSADSLRGLLDESAERAFAYNLRSEFIDDKIRPIVASNIKQSEEEEARLNAKEITLNAINEMEDEEEKQALLEAIRVSDLRIKAQKCFAQDLQDSKTEEFRTKFREWYSCHELANDEMDFMAARCNRMEDVEEGNRIFREYMENEVEEPVSLDWSE